LFDVHYSCLGMFHYGLLIENGILIFLNAVGASLQSFYVALYLLVARLKVLANIDLSHFDNKKALTKLTSP